MQNFENGSIPIPNLKAMFTWKNGFLLLAAVLAGVAVYNFSIVRTRSYAAADGSTDLTAMIIDQAMTYLPGLGAAGLAFISSFFGVKPEVVSALLAWLKNPKVVSAETRATIAVLQWLADIYKDRPEIANVISNLAQEIAKHQFPVQQAAPTPSNPSAV